MQIQSIHASKNLRRGVRLNRRDEKVKSSCGFGYFLTYHVQPWEVLLAGIFLSYMPVQEEENTIVISQPIFAQLGIPSDSILLNRTNMTAQIAPTITENITVTPAPEVNNTLIGRSTPTTSNTTLQIDNKTGEAEPLGGIKQRMDYRLF